MRLSDGHQRSGAALRHMPKAVELQLVRVRQGPESSASVLDTYKQSAQPNIHAGLRPIQGVER
jgi:hypothetical protein